MNKVFESELLKNAIDIGEEIIDKAIIDSNGIHWRTVKSVSIADSLETGVDETIYVGVSGIVLFYIELYKATNSETYLKYVNSSANWLIDHCKKTPATQGFYAGRMGVAFTLLKVAEVTQKKHYLNKAAEIAFQFKDILAVPVQTFNLHNGLAGTILGLLYLHAETKENWILDSIYDGIEYLIKNVKSNDKGFYWDISSSDSRSINTKPLCSMPFGSSGIGALFLQLSKYFDNKDYKYFGIQALNYDDQYYNSDLNNWPDFRIDIDREILPSLTKSYLKDDRSRFESNNYCSDWMFGTAGHGFTRALAHYVLNDENLDHQVNSILNKLKPDNINDKWSNHTIATGTAGVGLLFLFLSRSQKNQSCFENAIHFAKKIMDDRTNKGFYQFGFSSGVDFEDDSLLMGNAGIGYFYLKLFNKDGNSVLLPNLNTSIDMNGEHNVYHFNVNRAIDIIAKAWYPSTFSIIKNRYVFKTSELDPNFLKKSLTYQIEQTIDGLNEPQIFDAYSYDKIKLDVWQDIANNYGHFMVCRKIEVSKNVSVLERNSKAVLMEQILKLHQYSYFGSNQWDWKNASAIAGKKNEKEIITIYSLGEEYTLSEIQYFILNAFSTFRKAKYVYKTLMDTYGANDVDNDYLLHSFIDTIRFFMSKGILVCVKKTVFKNLFSKPNSLKKGYQKL